MKLFVYGQDQAEAVWSHDLRDVKEPRLTRDRLVAQ